MEHCVGQELYQFVKQEQQKANQKERKIDSDKAFQFLTEAEVASFVKQLA